MSSYYKSVGERHTADPAHEDAAGTGTLRPNSNSNSRYNNTSHTKQDEEHQNLSTIEPTPISQPSTTPSSTSQPSPPNTTSLTRYLQAPISPTCPWTSHLLLGLALATGINDAATFIDYHLFVSNQTGNTVFLGIGALNPNTIFDLRHVGLSLGLFLFGGLVSGQISNHLVGQRTRWWVVLSNGVQTGLMGGAAALRYWYATQRDIDAHSDSRRSESVISLLAFARGMQVAMARGLGVPEITTGMITSAWIDLVVDEKLWAVWRRDESRDRRLGSVLCILAGGFIGAAAGAYCAPALPLLLAACVKACVTVGFALVKGGEMEETRDEPRE